MSALLRKPSAFEDSFVHEQDVLFKARARRNRLVGLWAAATMGRDDATAYAEEVAGADIEEADGAFKRLRRDFEAAGVEVLDEDIRARMVALLKEAAADMLAR